MSNFQQKGAWKNILHSKPVLFFLGVGIIIFAWSILGFFGKMQETEKNKKIAEDRIIYLEQQKSKLTASIESLNTDQGKEKVFRENFGLAKDGEGEIVILDDKTSSPPPPPKPTSSFTNFLKNWFK